MEMILTEYDDGVAVLKLNRGTTNALNLELLTELSRTIKKVDKDPDVNSIVLTSSSEKFFCIGYDIRELYTISQEDFTVFYHEFNQVLIDLYTVLKPTVAAITGHAIAGGCALTLGCDYRYIAEGRKLMGINVLRLGLPAPYLVNAILERIVGARVARDIIDTGEFYPPDQLVQMGLVDCIVPLNEVIPQSIEKARFLGSLPQKSFVITKRDRVEWIEVQVLKRLAEKERFFVECFFSDEARQLLKEALEKF